VQKSKAARVVQFSLVFVVMGVIAVLRVKYAIILEARNNLK